MVRTLSLLICQPQHQKCPPPKKGEKKGCLPQRRGGKHLLPVSDPTHPLPYAMSLCEVLKLHTPMAEPSMELPLPAYEHTLSATVN